MKYYTCGEILRGKLLKNFRGNPYGDKSAILRVVNGLKYRIIRTPWGPAKAVPMSEIKRHNENSLFSPADSE